MEIYRLEVLREGQWVPSESQLPGPYHCVEVTYEYLVKAKKADKTPVPFGYRIVHGDDMLKCWTNDMVKGEAA